MSIHGLVIFCGFLVQLLLNQFARLPLFIVYMYENAVKNVVKVEKEDFE